MKSSAFFSYKLADSFVNDLVFFHNSTYEITQRTTRENWQNK